jgi:folate-dependent phosphoribosylglycinamide formyltransferase PurN
MEPLVKLYNYEDAGQMSVVGLISGSGTNLIKIIEHELELKNQRRESPYHVAAIFSDNPKSNANEIGGKFGIPVLTYSLEKYCNLRGKNIRDMQSRVEYEEEVMKFLNKASECSVFAYAGYMRKASPVFINSAIGVNVHPADLTVISPDGRRKYRGDHAVRDAIKAGEREIRSTTHIVTDEVDGGPILMVSAPLQVSHPISGDILDRMSEHYQSALKEKGDWVIFPKTLEYIADGRFAKDSEDRLYFDGKPIPNGVRLE